MRTKYQRASIEATPNVETHGLIRNGKVKPK